jgi:ABC-2 type transport system ATP-binding protein
MAAEGRTLLLTTQYLEEADQLADRIAVVDAGRVIAEGTPDQLKAAVGGEQIELTLARGADVAAAAAAVREHATGPVRVDAALLTVQAPVSATAGMTSGVVRSLDAAGVPVDSVTVHRPSLNEVFLALTGAAAGPETDRGTERELEGALA